MDYTESSSIIIPTTHDVLLQIGCGNSLLASGNVSPPPDQLNMETFMAQIDVLRQKLNLPRCHIFGHGWGGALALNYAAQGVVKGIASLTLSSTPSSYATLIADRRRCAVALGDALAAALLNEDNVRVYVSSSSSSDSYARAWLQYQQHYICRTHNRPALPGCVQVAEGERSASVFESLCGGQMFTVNGQLAKWSAANLTGQLQDMPVLVTRGEYDEVSDENAKGLIVGLPKGRIVTFAGAGSYTHIDAWEDFLTELEHHMSAADTRAAKSV